MLLCCYDRVRCSHEVYENEKFNDPPIELGSASAAIELESVAAVGEDEITGDHIPAQIPETARDTLGVLEICFDNIFF